MKIVSENQFSGKTNFYTIASSVVPLQELLERVLRRRLRDHGHRHHLHRAPGTDSLSWFKVFRMAGTIYPQHSEGNTVVRCTKAQLSALARHAAVCPALLSMLGQPNFEITRFLGNLENISGYFFHKRKLTQTHRGWTRSSASLWLNRCSWSRPRR